MIFERLANLNFDVSRLRDQLEYEVLGKYEPVYLNSGFGGWSLLSASGSYRDGWQDGYSANELVEGKWRVNQDKVKELGLKSDIDHCRPTELFRGYFKDVIYQLHHLGFCPRRVRISQLKPGGATVWHRDALPQDYAVRLHIPIITNPGAVFMTEDERAHLPADGSAYLINVNRLHRVVNSGTESRYHLIMQAWDFKGVSQHHQFGTWAAQTSM